MLQECHFGEFLKPPIHEVVSAVGRLLGGDGDALMVAQLLDATLVDAPPVLVGSLESAAAKPPCVYHELQLDDSEFSFGTPSLSGVSRLSFESLRSSWNIGALVALSDESVGRLLERLCLQSTAWLALSAASQQVQSEPVRALRKHDGPLCIAGVMFTELSRARAVFKEIRTRETHLDEILAASGGCCVLGSKCVWLGGRGDGDLNGAPSSKPLGMDASSSFEHNNGGQAAGHDRVGWDAEGLQSGISGPESAHWRILRPLLASVLDGWQSRAGAVDVESNDARAGLNGSVGDHFDAPWWVRCQMQPPGGSASEAPMSLSSSPDPPVSVSLSFWMYAFDGGDAEICSSGAVHTGRAGSRRRFAFCCRIGTDSRIDVHVSTIGCGETHGVLTLSNVQAVQHGVWTHVALSISATARSNSSCTVAVNSWVVSGVRRRARCALSLPRAGWSRV